MLRANYIHYIAIYSRSARPKFKFVGRLGQLWVSSGRGLGARLTPYYYYFFYKNIHTKGTQTPYSCHRIHAMPFPPASMALNPYYNVTRLCNYKGGVLRPFAFAVYG